MLSPVQEDVRAAAAAPALAPARGFKVVGVKVHALQIPDVIERMRAWIFRRDRTRWIAVTGMHGISEALRDDQFRDVLNDADLVVPDGMPLVWLGRWKGEPLRHRVYGPALLEEFCRATVAEAYRHYFLGGADGVAERLAAVLSERFPGLQVAGTFSPPFRPATDGETRDLQRRINDAAPDIVWVGLGTPKQEAWMATNRGALRAPVLIGVGAAFDLHTGRLRQAPAWMRENGLEWLYRLSREPRRLWKRYLVGGSRFVGNVTLELCGLKHFD